MGHKMARNVCYLYIGTYVPIYPITLNGYIYSPGKKIEKFKKNRKFLKKIKKLKIFETISGALARSLISQQFILKQGFQKTHFPTVLEVEIFFAVDLANF